MLNNTFIKKYSVIFISVIFLNVMNFIGCEKVEDEEENPVESYHNNTAKIEGRVFGDGGYSNFTSTNVSGAIISLSEINEDGSLKIISQSDVTTGKNGNFHTSVDYAGKNKILVSAAFGTKAWRSIINNDVKNGLTYYIQPLNDESTAESEVYIQALKNNYTNVTYTDIAIFVDETIAENINQNIVTPDQIASVVEEIKNIENIAISDKQFVTKSIDIEKLDNSISFAQSLLERDLYYAYNQTDYQAAFSAFYESIVTSYINSGLEADVFYKILEIAHRALLQRISNFDESSRIEIEKRASQVRAYVLNYAVQSKFNRLEPDPQMYKMIVSAGQKLFVTIDQAQTHAGIISNFSEYHVEALDAISDLLGVRSDKIKNLDNNIYKLKSALITSIENQTTSDSLIKEYLNFFSESEALISNMIASDDDQVRLSAEILILLNLQF